MKGSDASWIGDVEVPEEMQEFSDDEDERLKKNHKNRLERKRQHGSAERHKKFEKTMNQCNTLNTRVHKLLDARSSVIRNNTIPQNSRADWNPYEIATAGSMMFDPSRPPPGFVHSRLFDYGCYSGGGGGSGTSSAKVPHLAPTAAPNYPPSFPGYMPTMEDWNAANPQQPGHTWGTVRQPRNFYYPYTPLPATATATSSSNSAGDQKDGNPRPVEQTPPWGFAYGPWMGAPVGPNNQVPPGMWVQPTMPPTTAPNVPPQGPWNAASGNPYSQSDPSLFKNQ